MQEIPLNTTKMRAYKEDGVGWMIFNNPERLNALALEMQEAIPVILGNFAADPDVRVVVMTGTGDRAFVSGADISEFDSRRADPVAIAEFNRITEEANAAYGKLNKPLIAMIRGFCLGGGLLVSLHADLRIATDDSQYGIPAARVGLGYAYVNVKAMIDLIGAGHTRELCITGNRIDAERALQMGLITQHVPSTELEDTVKQLALAIADNAPLTVLAIRAAIEESMKDASERDIDRIDRMVAECFASEDYAEGRKAFAEKRRPVFKGR